MVEGRFLFIQSPAVCQKEPVACQKEPCCMPKRTLLYVNKSSVVCQQEPCCMLKSAVLHVEKSSADLRTGTGSHGRACLTLLLPYRYLTVALSLTYRYLAVALPLPECFRQPPVLRDRRRVQCGYGMLKEHYFARKRA